MRLIPIQPQNLYRAYKDIEKHIIAGLEYVDDKYTLADIKEMLSMQQMILWVVYNDKEGRATGCLLTQTIAYPRVQSLAIFLLAGENFSHIVTLLDDLKDYARSIDCETIEFYGRSGWEKVLKPFAFEKTHTVMRLKL